MLITIGSAPPGSTTPVGRTSSVHGRILNLIGWREVVRYNLSLRNDSTSRKTPLGRSGSVELLNSTLRRKMCSSEFWNFGIFSKICPVRNFGIFDFLENPHFLAFAQLVIRILAQIFLFGRSRAECNENDAPKNQTCLRKSDFTGGISRKSPQQMTLSLFR